MTNDSEFKAAVQIWSTGPKNAYADGIPVPRVTYRCKVQSPKGAHKCKRVVDHVDQCLCICGKKFKAVEQ